MNCAIHKFNTDGRFGTNHMWDRAGPRAGWKSEKKNVETQIAYINVANENSLRPNTGINCIEFQYNVNCDLIFFVLIWTDPA
jgi:hypothetical protein